MARDFSAGKKPDQRHNDQQPADGRATLGLLLGTFDQAAP